MLFLSLCFPASAEIRILNYTGEPLKVDVLHANGQSRDVAISGDVTLSAVVGPQNPMHTSEVLVVKSADGTELKRDDVQSQAVIVISRNSNGIHIGNAGWYKGNPHGGQIKVLNATKQNLHYHYETPSFLVRKGKIESDYPSLRAWGLGQDDFKANQEVRVKLGINEDASGEGQALKAGHVYYATLVDGKLKLVDIGVN